MADISKTISNVKFNDAGGNKVTAYFKDGVSSAAVDELLSLNQKNYIYFCGDLSSSMPSSGFTITYQNDGSVTFNGATGSSSRYVGMEVTFDEAVPMIICGFNSNVNISLQIKQGSTIIAADATGVGVEFTPTVGTTYTVIITLSPSITYSNEVVKPMICKKTMWDVSHDYVTRNTDYFYTYANVCSQPEQWLPIPKINGADLDSNYIQVASTVLDTSKIFSNGVVSMYDFGLIFTNSTDKSISLTVENADGTTVIIRDNVYLSNLPDLGDGVRARYYFRLKDKYGNISKYMYSNEIAGKYSNLVAGDAVVDLVDNCKDKNKLDISSFSISNVGAVITDDSIAITSKGTWAYAYFTLPLKAGTYVWSCSVDVFNTEHGSRIRFVDTPSGAASQFRDDVTITGTGTVNAEFTLSEDATVYIKYVVNNSSTTSSTDTMTFSANMVCSKEDWYVSRTYEPYRPPYDDLLSNVDTAYKTSSISMVETDSSSTADAFVATVPNITELRDGLIFALRNTVISNNSGATLNVNNLGAKTMYTTNGGGIVPQFFGYQSICVFVYNSKLNSNAGGWVLIDHNPSSMGIGYTTCDTAAADTAKIATLTGYKKVAGGIIVVRFTNAVPANSTLNISSQGEATIRYATAAITDGIIEAGDMVTMMFSGTYYNVLAIDKAIKRTSIPTVAVASSSTATAFVATVPEISALRSGLVVCLINTKADNNLRATLNVNSLGAKNIYTMNGQQIPAYFFGLNARALFIYDSTYNSNAGAWIILDHSIQSLGMGYCTCDTAADTAAKTATMTGYKTISGGIIVVKFTNAVPASATLNINELGAKTIRWRGANIKAGIIEAGDTVTMILNGSYYYVLAIDKAISLATLGCGYVEATLGTSPAFTATLNNFTLKTGGIVTVKFSNDVPANATLNINSTGDGAIYWKGAKITANVIKSGDVVLFSHYSARWNLMAIDRTAGV